MNDKGSSHGRQGRFIHKEAHKDRKNLGLEGIKKHVWQQERFMKKRYEITCKRYFADINFDGKRIKIILTQVSIARLSQGTRERGDEVTR